MRFKKKPVTLEKHDHIKQISYFAWLPVTINNETRWLEKVTINGYYFIGEMTGKIRFMEQSFAD